MPGRLLGSFRSGNLAEHLGVLLLKGVAAVAEVARPEDVGLDAIATLLRPNPEDRCLYAEDSFVVQFKSASTESIRYDQRELEWFVSQPLPMFIGLVSMKENRISLYSTLYANHCLLQTEATTINMQFGNLQKPRVVGEHLETATVHLGVPVLEWSLDDLTNDAWPKSAYRTLKRFLEVARQEHHLMKFQAWSKITWTTNAEASIQAAFVGQKGDAEQFAEVASQSVPILRALLLVAFGAPEGKGSMIAEPILSLLSGLKEFGVDIDPSNTLSIISKVIGIKKVDP